MIGVADSVHATCLARLSGSLWPSSCGCPGPSRVGYKVRGTFASILASADPAMPVSEYTLPPPVYLPSSGGYTSSRLVSEVSLLPLRSRRLTNLRAALPSARIRVSSVQHRRGREVGR